MHNNPFITHQLREVDAKSEELIQEFLQHCAEVQAKNPALTDQRKIFEGWVIQKIAGLQVTVLKIMEQWDRRDG